MNDYRIIRTVGAGYYGQFSIVNAENESATTFKRYSVSRLRLQSAGA